MMFKSQRYNSYTVLQTSATTHNGHITTNISRWQLQECCAIGLLSKLYQPLLFSISGLQCYSVLELNDALRTVILHLFALGVDVEAFGIRCRHVDDVECALLDHVVVFALSVAYDECL